MHVLQYIRLYPPSLLWLCRKYLPLLKKFPAEYIYEPWKAPRSVQQAAGCIVGKDYPHPIVQHEVVSKKNIQRMKLAYAKRSSDPAESPSKSPSKKQGTAWIVYFYEMYSVTFVLFYCSYMFSVNSYFSSCFPPRCKTQGSICHRHADEKRKEELMFAQNKCM